MLRSVLKFFGFLFAWGAIGGVFALIGVMVMVWMYGRDLPDTSTLAAYQPDTVSRLYNGDGMLMAEYVRERRVFTPIDEIPDLVKHAFISAEDKNFYTHPGFDLLGIGKAVFDAVMGANLRGASTIPQQVMKNFLLSGERTGERKIKEIILAVRLESTLSKDQILELYLNEIFLGQNAYGVTAAAQSYFNKTLEELTPGEAAYLAALPQAPSKLHPVHQRERALWRRNYVLREMVENGYLAAAEASLAREQPLSTVQSGEIVVAARRIPPRDYFSTEVQRQLTERMGEDQVLGGGLTVRATIDETVQAEVAKALRAGLEARDRSLGTYHGPVGQLSPALLEAGILEDEAAWRAALAETRVPRDIPGWHVALVTQVGQNAIRIGIEDVPDDEDGHFIPIRKAGWTGARRPEDLFALGDIIHVSADPEDGGWTLRQIPELEGAVMVMDARNGRVLAMQGGFSFQHSEFNRATQATRQPGSSFKPFVYATALDLGFSPATVVADLPVVIDTGTGEPWRPKNAGGNFLGFVPMRIGIEKSRNLMTVRIAQDVGMEAIARYAERFGVYEDMPPHLSYALGAGETTLWKMVAAYGMFANGGLRIEPTVVDRVQDRWGRTVYAHDTRDCRGCAEESFEGQPEPWVVNDAKPVMDQVTAYQLTDMMQGVIDRGTATILRDLDLNIAGKTG
ncbi:MAG: PBP1A family penicillin-binding protein, partial [Pseudomonadota bacterium]